MTRWLLLIPLAMVSAGCRAPGNVYAPYGSTCVPPPGTGAAGAPYYQAPAYQAPAYGAPYGGYPAGYPYQAPAPQGSTSRAVLPGGPQFAVSPYMGNEGAWTSSAQVVPSFASASPQATSSSVNQPAPLQPRPSGQVIASGARFSHNENLAWGSGFQPSSASAPYAASADSAPTIAAASYSGPVRPAVVRSGVVYDAPVQVTAPIYYPNDYVLDPYASNYDPYASESMGNLATAAAGWTPR